jgi:spore cortex formation protein SpoVR/YcgB (stage V sporulation)
MQSLLFTDSEWSFDRLKATYNAIEEIALGDLGLDVYPNQIEIISSEQMLDAYSSHGMPLMYRHWSFGKHFARDQMMYQKG